MDTVILAGGLGTRLSEETGSRPKPMVTIGGRPILWHIMSIYGHHGFKDFVLALGYRSDVIKEYLMNMATLSSSFSIDLETGDRDILDSGDLFDWRVTALDTGERTETGGRVLQAGGMTKGDSFMMTYGDGVSDVDVTRLVEFHRSHGKLATVTVVRPPARFGRVELSGEQVTRFGEKPQAEEGWINGGFFVLDRKVLEYIDGNATVFEREPLERLANDGELMAYRHDGFWQPMDTLRERGLLEDLWSSGHAPWKVW